MSARSTVEAQAMLQVLALDPSAVVKFSEYTGQWYIEARIEQSDGCIISGIVEHRNDPLSAVLAFHAALKAIDDKHVLVSNAGRETRRHWRWNGGAFAEVPDYLLPWKLGSVDA